MWCEHGKPAASVIRSEGRSSKKKRKFFLLKVLLGDFSVESLLIVDFSFFIMFAYFFNFLVSISSLRVTTLVVFSP